jgi:hypothetical protein
MTAMSVRTWLAHEVVELLSVGPVGLYEMIDMLGNADFDLASDVRQSAAKDVATDLVNRGLATIGRLRWPRDDVLEGPLAISVLDEPASWGWLRDKRYLALVPPR